MPKIKFLFLGFDGLDFDFVDGLLPKFKLQQYGRLFPEKDYVSTGPSWGSIYTGVSVKKHGIIDQVGIKSGGSKCLEDCGYKPFWDILNGINMGVFSLKITGYRDFKNNPLNKNVKFFISGAPVINKIIAFYPNGLSKLYPNTFDIDNLGGFANPTTPVFCRYSSFKEAVYGDVKQDHEWRLKTSEQFFKNINLFFDLYSNFHNQKILFLYDLINLFKADFVAVQFGLVDHIAHWIVPNLSDGLKDTVHGGFAHESLGKKILIAIYKEVFRIKKILLELLDPEWVLICSDHGYFNMHTFHGFYSLENFENSLINKRIDIKNYDICPTILDIFGIDKLDYMDGNIIKYDMENTMLERELRGLGYL